MSGMTDTGWLCLYCLVEEKTEVPARSILQGTAVCTNHARDVAERMMTAEPLVAELRTSGSEPV